MEEITTPNNNLIILTQWFDPEPAFKGLFFAKMLKEKGWNIEVLTGFPNYPGGKLYPGYKVKAVQKEIIEDIQVTRLPLYPSHNNSGIKRGLNYISFAFSSLFYSLLFLKRPNIIYIYHPPLTTGLVGAIVKSIRNIPFVLDIQDLWPDTLSSTGMISNKYALSLIGYIANWIYKKADHLVVLSPGFKTKLVERGIPEEKIEVIQNWCNEDHLLNKEPERPQNMPTASFTVLFAGNLGKAQALDTVLFAADIVYKINPSIRFVFIGNGVELSHLKELKSHLELKNVDFLPQVPSSEIVGYLAHADVLLVHLKNEPLFEITIPSKIQVYMAVKKPILLGIKGDSFTLIENAHCGFNFEPENTQELAEKVLMMALLTPDKLNALGGNGYSYYMNFLHSKIGVNRFSSVFKRIRK